MTKQEAKELTLEVWRYIAKHNLSSKMDLPLELFKKIEKLLYKCPLCHVLKNCFTDCPLNKPSPCFCGDSLYSEWHRIYAVDKPERRKKAAQKIVKAVQVWKPEDENQ